MIDRSADDRADGPRGNPFVLQLPISHVFSAASLPIRPITVEALGKAALAHDVASVEDDEVCRESHLAPIVDPRRLDESPELLRDFDRLEPRPGFEPRTDDFPRPIGTARKLRAPAGRVAMARYRCAVDAR